MGVYGQVVSPSFAAVTKQASFGRAAAQQYLGAQVAPWQTPRTVGQPPMMQGASSLQRFSGAIKNWNPVKGWGFISSQDTMNVYGKDIFLHKKELYGQEPCAGSAVQFSVQVDQGGRPVATTVAINGGVMSTRPTVVP